MADKFVDRAKGGGRHPSSRIRRRSSKAARVPAPASGSRPTQAPASGVAHDDNAKTGHEARPGRDRVGHEPRETRRIKVVESRVQRWLFVLAPLVAALILALFARDPMFASGLLAVVVTFVVFHVFATRIPETFERLPNRKLVPDDDRFRAFEVETSRLLNHRVAALVAAIVFACFGFARFPWVGGGIPGFIDRAVGLAAKGSPTLLADSIAEAALGFVLGLVAWRMGVIGWRLRTLGRDFDLRIQRAHPDKCGGFRPLGDLCLWNGLLVTVPAIFLGVWIVLGPKLGYGTTYVGLQTALLGFLILLATTLFVGPLWSIHLRMSLDADRLRREVDDVGQTIDRVSQELLEKADAQSPEDSEALRRKLAIQQDIYRASDTIPTWPVDVRLAAKFGSAQIVPLLGLTGLSKPIIDLIGSVLNTAAT